MTVATDRVVRTMSAIPAPGQRYLSINLAMVDVEKVWQMARRWGLEPQLMQLRYPSGGTEVHAMLWQGAIEAVPEMLEEWFDELSAQFPWDAVWSPTGGWPADHDLAAA
jgi:hypothetical protein